MFRRVNNLLRRDRISENGAPKKMISDWSSVTLEAFQNVWQGIIVDFLPKLLAGLVVFIIGWMIASGVGKILARLLRKLNFDSIFVQSGWKNALENADIKVNPSEFIGAILKWVLVIVFLQIFVEILGLTAFAGFLTSVLDWLPNLIVAAAIFVVSIIMADILEKIIKASVMRLEIRYSNLLGAAVRGSIYVFAILAILLQLKVAESIINTMIMGFVGMFSLAFGLAFGLGGKDAAADAIKAVREKLKDH